MSTEIKLVQVPIIQHKLIEVGANVTKRIEELNLSNLVATDDTIKSLKELRAELNKEFTDFENDRKALKLAVANPYMEFEKVYEIEISGKYKQAVETLKDKIAVFENKVKADKKANIESYFAELCADAKIDFLKFEHAGLEINLSTSEKQYKEKCAEFVNRVADDVILIQGIEYPVDTMVEYKKTLNASKAITTVRERKEAERLEKERVKAIETSRRLAMIRGLNMVFRDMTKSYNWIDDDSIFILYSDIENLSVDDFRKEFVKIENTIKAINAEKEKAEEARQEQLRSQTQSEIAPELSFEQQKQVVKQVAKPLAAPVEVIPEKKPEPVKKASVAFEIIDTMPRIMELRYFLISNNYIYKNVKNYEYSE